MSNAIWCVGRNYQDHAKEMGAPLPQTPLIFLKPWSCLTQASSFRLAPFSNHIEHEIEVAVKLGQKLEPSQVALALDLTARDIQTDLKKKGHPWALAKSFKGSCPISTWIDYKDDSWFSALEFELSINGNTRQKGKIKDMIFPLKTIINYLDKHFPLEPGDILLTGTPSGVAPLAAGDKIVAQIKGELDWESEVGTF